MEHPTPYPKLNSVLHELVQGIQAVLDSSFVAACLQGSFAVGDFDEHSDVDYLMVIEEELSSAQVEALQAVHGRIYALESYWAQHLEGSYFPKAILKQHSDCSQKLWYLDNGARALIRDTHCNTVVVRWTALHHGVSLAGPPPVALIDPIPVETLRRDMLATLNHWGQEILENPAKYSNRFYQSFVVLSYCRMLYDLLQGDTGSKRAAAAWAQANLDPAWGGLIERTWAARPRPEISVRQPADPADFQSTLEFVRYIMELSRQAAASLQLEWE